MLIVIKNISSSIKTWSGQEFTPGFEYTLQSPDKVSFPSDSNLMAAVATGEAVIGDGLVWMTSVDGWAYLSGQTPGKVTVSNTPPFASPDYRTKRDATEDPITVAPDSLAVMDYRLLEERYISGGLMITENAQFGDHVSAEIYDKDGVIPEPYRSPLCENWPTVATYINKEYVKIENGAYSSHEINTYPLNAKITPGLYLRLTYHAVAGGVDRRAAVNYYLTKRIV